MPWLRGSGPKFWSMSQLSACNKTSKCCDTDFNTLLHNTSWTLVCLRVLNHNRKTNCSGQKHPSTRRPNLSYLICSFQFAESIIPLGLTKARDRELGFFLFSITKESESNIRSFSATGSLKVLGFIWKSLQLTLQPMSTQNALFAIYENFSCQEISQTSECHQRHKLHTAQVVDLWQQALAAAARSPPLGQFQFQQHSSLPVLWRTHLDLLQVIVNIARRCELISQSAWPRRKHCQIAWFEKPQDCSSECLTFKMFIHSPFPSMS